nr:ribonuclease H-like domain-containing protein [Tanacetum cinerariifolium]
MMETMEQYMSKTRGNYRSGIVRPKINDKTHFELKGQYLKEHRENTFSGSEHENENEHIEKVLEIVDLFHFPEFTQDQVMRRVFSMSLTGVASRWLRNEPSDKEVSISEGSSVTTTKTYMDTYKNVSQDIRNQLNAEAEAVQIILTGIDNDIYSTVDACPNACKMWKAIERLKQGESIHVQDLETNLYWDFGKFTSQDGESLESYYSRIARTANLLALVAQQQPVYHPQNHPTHYSQNSSSKSQQAATRNRGKVIVNSPQPIYDQEPSIVAEDDEMSKDKEIDKLMALISLSGAGYDHQRLGNVVGARETVGTTVVQKSRIQCYNCKEFGHVARECQKPKRAKDAAYHREKMLLCKQEEAEIQLNAEQADWRDDTDDES